MHLFQPQKCVHIYTCFRACICCVFPSAYFSISPALMTPQSSLTHSNLIPGRNPGNILPSFFWCSCFGTCWLHSEGTWELADAQRAASGLSLPKPGSPEGATCHKKHPWQYFFKIHPYDSNINLHRRRGTGS